MSLDRARQERLVLMIVSVRPWEFVGGLASYEGHEVVRVDHAAKRGMGASDELGFLGVVIYDSYVRMYYVHERHGAFFRPKE